MQLPLKTLSDSISKQKFPVGGMPPDPLVLASFVCWYASAVLLTKVQ